MPGPLFPGRFGHGSTWRHEVFGKTWIKMQASALDEVLASNHLDVWDVLQILNAENKHF
jgi:hypothetical protein